MELDLLRTRLAAVVEPHPNVELVILFGSRSRGDARPNSDVDLAVLGVAIDSIGLAADLTDAIGLNVEVVDLSVDPPIVLLLAVLEDGIKIFERRPGSFGRFLSHTLADLETDLPAFRRMQRAFVQRVASRGLSGGE